LVFNLNLVGTSLSFLANFGCQGDSCRCIGDGSVRRSFSVFFTIFILVVIVWTKNMHGWKNHVLFFQKEANCQGLTTLFLSFTLLDCASSLSVQCSIMENKKKGGGSQFFTASEHYLNFFSHLCYSFVTHHCCEDPYIKLLF